MRPDRIRLPRQSAPRRQRWWTTREPPAKSPGESAGSFTRPSPDAGARWRSPVCRSPRRYCPATASPGHRHRRHRGHRVRPRCAGRVDLARLRRPGASAATARVLARLRHQRDRPLRGVLRARAVLAEPDPLVDGDHRLQRSARHRLTPDRRGLLRSPDPRRAGASWAVPLDGEEARPPHRQARRHRPGLDPRRRPHLPGHHWSAPRRPGQRRRQGVLRARHHDRGGREPARQQPAVRRTRLRRPLGLAGPSGPQVHRQGADRVGYREHRPRSRDGAHSGVRRPEHGR